MTTHPEYQYLNALSKILNEGEVRNNRTGIDTKSLFGLTFDFDLRKGFPLLTTKRMPFKTVLKELVFFIKGQTQTKILEDQGVMIWKGNTTREFLDSRGLQHLEEGDMGKMYGYQWRYWGGDQLTKVIEAIKRDPFSRRHIVSAWNADELDDMALCPCHVMYQFNVSSDLQYLDILVFQRSGDMFLGIPFNFASYGALLTLVAHMTNLKPRRMFYTIGDAHIYVTHEDAVLQQLERTPYPWPKVSIIKHEISLDDVNPEIWKLDNYQSHGTLKAQMAI